MKGLAVSEPAFGFRGPRGTIPRAAEAQLAKRRGAVHDLLSRECSGTLGALVSIAEMTALLRRPNEKQRLHHELDSGLGR